MPKRFGLRFSEWPQHDRIAWGRAIEPVDYFDDVAIAARWSGRTIAGVVAAYGRWLAFLSTRYPDALNEQVDARAKAAYFHDYAESLKARVKATSITSELSALALAFRALAPNEKCVELHKLVAIWRKRCERTNRNDQMIHPARLLSLGVALMESADQLDDGQSRARQYRDGLVIALLASRPLRRRTLAALDLDRHLRAVDNRYLLFIPGGDTKSEKAIEVEIPAHLCMFLNRYLTTYRPLLPGANQSSAFWPSSKAGALTHGAIFSLVYRRTFAALGVGIRLHSFRHIAATTFAREMPEALSMARDLLTHSRVDTTLSYYVQTRSRDASRVHRTAMEQLRDGDNRGRN